MIERPTGRPFPGPASPARPPRGGRALAARALDALVVMPALVVAAAALNLALAGAVTATAAIGLVRRGRAAGDGSVRPERGGGDRPADGEVGGEVGRDPRPPASWDASRF